MGTVALEASLHTCKIVNHSNHGRRQGDLAPPLDFEIFCKKGCFLGFEWEKNKFHHFWPPPGKILEKSSSAPLQEKILPTPMTRTHASLSLLPLVHQLFEGCSGTHYP